MHPFRIAGASLQDLGYLRCPSGGPRQALLRTGRSILRGWEDGQVHPRNAIQRNDSDLHLVFAGVVPRKTHG
jgi:hypothetical protein